MLKWLRRNRNLVRTTVSTLLLITALPLAIDAQASNRLFKRPKPPKTTPVAGPIVGLVGRGGDRPCPATPLPLVAVTPEQRVPNPASAAPTIQVWGKMTAANPTLWFYLPYSRKSAVTANFGFNGKETPITLPDQPGFVPVSIADLGELKVGQSYQWTLTVKCGIQPVVSGWIEWVEVDALKLQKLKAAKPTQQAVAYAQEGIWYDAVNILAIQRFQKPHDVTVNQLWQQLLGDLSDPQSPKEQRESIEKVVGQPIVQLPK
jgi:Domain of Unknown Function (DUF928)